MILHFGCLKQPKTISDLKMVQELYQVSITFEPYKSYRIICKIEDFSQWKVIVTIDNTSKDPYLEK